MTERLTKRQAQILDFIRDRMRTKGYPPSVREIGEAVGLSSSSTVHSHLSKLEELKLIRRDPTKPRAIEILEDSPWRSQQFIAVPLVGQVTAGSPILATENIEEVYQLPKELIRHDDVFMLSVIGDSMIEAGILNGDYVMVRRQSNANNGDIVVAMVEDEATVKRFFKEKGHYRLQPENQHLEPIFADEVTVLGKVVGLVRLVM